MKAPGDEFRVRARKRDGRCYELTMKGILDDAAADFLLVHGMVRGPENSSIGHAWLLDPVRGRVYDAVADRWFDEPAYMRTYAAVANRIYTRKEAATAMLAANHYGPWHV